MRYSYKHWSERLNEEPLGKPGRRWDNNIRIELKIGYDVVQQVSLT
jgi:hypothetical protein